MSADRYTLDTNILFYCIDIDAKNKREKSIALIEAMVSLDCVLTLQTLSEFYSSVTRKGRMPITEARDQVNDWMILFPIVSAEPATLKKAMLAVQEHSFSFWDSLQLETSAQAGVTKFYSEDLQHGRLWKGVEIINPFN